AAPRRVAGGSSPGIRTRRLPRRRRQLDRPERRAIPGSLLPLLYRQERHLSGAAGGVGGAVAAANLLGDERNRRPARPGAGRAALLFRVLRGILRLEPSPPARGA